MQSVANPWLWAIFVAVILALLALDLGVFHREVPCIHMIVCHLQPDEPVEFTERHYSVAEIAALWYLSQDSVRRMFMDEAGVMVIGDRTSTCKRRYTTLRVPESVLRRVHNRLTSV